MNLNFETVLSLYLANFLCAPLQPTQAGRHGFPTCILVFGS